MAQKGKSLKDLLGNEFICKNNKGEHVQIAFNDRLKDVKAVALYFSAHWCGPCQQFTPSLVKASKKWKEEGCEVIYVSSDGNAKEFEEYYGQMGDWLAYPIGHNQIKKLQDYVGIDGIPTLTVIDKNGKIIDEDAYGRGIVVQKGANAVYEWLDDEKTNSQKVFKDGTYSFIAEHSQKLLDVEGGSKDGGASIIQWDAHNQENQQFVVEKQKCGNYTVQCKQSGLYWDIEGGSNADSAKLIQWELHGNDNQLFKFAHYQDEKWTISNKKSGKVLEIEESAQNGGANVRQRQGANQLFRCVKL